MIFSKEDILLIEYASIDSIRTNMTSFNRKTYNHFDTPREIISMLSMKFAKIETSLH